MKDIKFLKFVLNDRYKGIQNLENKISDLERIKNILLKDIEDIKKEINEIEG